MTKEIDDDIGDDLLSLVFTACHPVLSTEARVALTAALAGRAEDGRDRPRLPGARIDRGAANRASEADPGRDARAVRGSEQGRGPARLSSVLEVIYLVFNEGYSATAGDDWMRPALCEDALRLGRILAELVPQEPEVHGLVALMEIQACARGRASARPESPCCCSIRDRARWDQLLIRRGLNALRRAEELRAERACMCCRPRSPPAMRGHARRMRRTGSASWRCMTRLRSSTRHPWWS